MSTEFTVGNYKDGVLTDAPDKSFWKIIESYFQTYDLDESKKQSFRQFIAHGLPALIQDGFPMVMQQNQEFHFILCEGLTMNLPFTTETDGTSHILDPKQARLRQDNYTLHIYMHQRLLIIKVPDDMDAKNMSGDDAKKYGRIIHNEVKEYVPFHRCSLATRTEFCHLRQPIFTKGECKYDTGSHLIKDGAEKNLMYREREANNKILTIPPEETRYSHTIEFRSEYVNKYRSTQTLYLNTSRAKDTEASSLL